jgi:hypothetical protein
MRPTFQTYLRLLLRTPSFWVVALGSIGAMGFISFGNLLLRTLELSDAILIPLFFLAQLLLTIAGSQQERSERVEELLEALPYQLGRYLPARILAAYMPWLVVTVLIWVGIGVATLASGHPVDWLLLARHWAMAAPVTLLFTTCLGFLIGQFLRHGLLAYLAGTLLWLLGPFVPIFLSKDADGDVIPPLTEIAASARYFPVSDQGYGTTLELLLLNRLYVLGLAVLMGALLLRAHARRRQAPTRSATIAALLAGAIAIGGGGGLTWIWHSREAAYTATLAAVPHDDGRVRPHSAQNPAPTPSVAAADQYQLNVTLDPATHRLQVAGRWTLTNRSPQAMPEPTFALNRALTLTKLTTQTGDTVPFRREGDLVILGRPLAPGEHLALQGEWSGIVWEWRRKDGLKLGAHISEHSILLPANWGWYPTTADQPLAYTRDLCYGGPDHCKPQLAFRGPVPPASFDLTVSGSSLTLLHNAGQHVFGLYLIGTPYPVQRIGEVELALSPLSQPRAEALAQEYAQVMAAFSAMVPRAASPLRIVEVPGDSWWGAPYDQSMITFPEAILISGPTIGLRLGHDQHTVISSAAYTLAKTWWPASREPSAQVLAEGLTTYMTEATIGLPEGSRANNAVPLVLKKVAETKGEEAARQILRQLHERVSAGGPTMRDFLALVQPLADQPKVQEALKQLQPWVMQP